MNRYQSSVFCFITGMYWYSMYTYVPILPIYAGFLGADHEMIGLIIGLYGLTQMLLRIPIGIISDAQNRRKVFVVLGLIVSTISSIGMWLFPTPAALAVFRALSGVAAAVWVVFPVLFTSYYPGQSTKAVGYINSVNYGAQVVAMLIGGFVAQHFGSEYTFLAAALGGIIGLVMTLQIAEDNMVDRKPMQLNDLIEIVKNRNIMVVSGLAVFSQIMTYATVFAFTPVAAKNLGASSLELGLLAIVSVLPAAFAAALSGTLFANHLGERRTIMLGFLITAGSCAYIPFAGGILGLYVSQIVGGFGRGLTFSILMGRSIKDIEPGRRATAMGFFQAIYGLGMFLGPVLAGLTSNLAGITVSFWLIALIGIAGAIFSATLLKDREILAGEAHG